MWKLSIPILGSMILETLYNTVDSMWVGRSSVIDLASVNISSFSIWIMAALVAVVTVGANSIIANKVGEATKRPQAADEAIYIAQWSIMLSAIIGLLEVAVVIIWGEDILRMTSGGGEDLEAVVQVGYAYLAIFTLATPFFCLCGSFSAILRAYGDTQTPLFVDTIGIILNAVLDPILIFGWNFIPSWGAVGAAVASDISILVMFLIYIHQLSQPNCKFIIPKTRPQRLKFVDIKEIISIGLPVSASYVIFSLVYMAVTPVIAHFGPAAVAALGVGHRMESFNYAICMGISVACITMVGQNIGAGLIQRAKEAVMVGVSWALGINVIVFLAFMFLPGYFAGLFGTDEDMIAHAISYLKIIAISQIFSGVCIVLEGAFAGGGRTTPPMCVSIPCSLARIPLCYWFIFKLDLGLWAVWWTFSLLTILRCCIVMLMFRMGLWVDETHRGVL